MVKLIPIIYRNKEYPEGVSPAIKEIPAHFDSNVRIPDFDYCLHTEYSYGPRRFLSHACKDLAGIMMADKKGVPKLWFDEAWAKDFVQFVFKFVGDNKPPKIIEIHPPFDDYCACLSRFLRLYECFEKEVTAKYPETHIFIENRCGSQYADGSFILSTVEDLIELAALIRKRKLKLRFALDIPQLFSAHNLDRKSFSKRKLQEIFEKLYPLRDLIASIHIWGKCIGKNGKPSAHMGTLDSYFKGLMCKEPNSTSEFTPSLYKEIRASEDNEDIKSFFLSELYNLLDDNLPRYFLPEVNSKSEHLQSIVNDLIKWGFKFI